MSFDPTPQYQRDFNYFEEREADLAYSEGCFSVSKLSDSPDTNVALVQRKITSGQKAYCEFFIKQKGDEFLVGITHNAMQMRSLSGWTLIKYPTTWAYWDRRVGLQFHGNGVPVSGEFMYGTGDRIGISLDMCERTVEFFKNGISVGKAEDLPIEASYSELDASRSEEEGGEREEKEEAEMQPIVYQFFAMLDLSADVVEISDYY
jgi:hypothetical protein